MSTTTEQTDGVPRGEDVRRYVDATRALQATSSEIHDLESSEGVESFNRQVELLKRRLLDDPKAFRDMFIADGMAAAAWEFNQSDLSPEFVERLWTVLQRGDDASSVIMRFIWNLPIGKKRAFIRGLDQNLGGRYPMFDGLSTDWPAGSSIPPYIRTPEQRSDDFGLVNQGYYGYMTLGFSARDIELLVWLEALRDKQCADSPCELGIFIAEHKPPKGGCPVRIHIPRMLELIGQGRFREAFETIEGSNPLPDVTGRVCPQELQCQGVCLHKLPMAIGQVEWFLPQHQKMVDPGAAERRFSGFPDPWKTATKPPIAIVGSGPLRASPSRSSRRSTRLAACSGTAFPSSAFPTT
jgi:glutamate synthase (NADPH/NADH) small chain